MKALRLIKYGEVHEDAASRRIKKQKYTQMPLRRKSLGWKVAKKDESVGEVMSGIYLECVQLLAESELPAVRGVFADSKKPWNLKTIAAMIDRPHDLVIRAFDLWMNDEDVHFVDEIDWPIDCRLIEETYASHRGKPEELVSRVITQWSIDPDGLLIDYEGNRIDPNVLPESLGSIQLAYHNPPDRFDRHRVAGSIDYSATTGTGTGTGTLTGNKTGTGKSGEGACDEAPGKSEGSGKEIPLRDSGSGSGPPAADWETQRARVKQRWLLAVSPLLGKQGGRKTPADSSRTASDRGQADSTFAMAWPEFEDESPPIDVCRQRVDELTSLIPKAAKQPTPMKYLRGCANRRARKWAESGVSA